jgi:hypothetical protein
LLRSTDEKKNNNDIRKIQYIIYFIIKNFTIIFKQDESNFLKIDDHLGSDEDDYFEIPELINKKKSNKKRSLTKILKKGILMQKSFGITRTFKSVYCVLSSTKFKIYNMEEEWLQDKPAKYSIELDSCQFDSTLKDNCFSFTTKGRVYIIKASSENEKKEWVSEFMKFFF